MAIVSARPAPIQSSAGCRLTFVNGATTTAGVTCPAAGTAEATSAAPATTSADIRTRRRAAAGAAHDRYGPNRCPGTRDVMSYMQSSSMETVVSRSHPTAHPVETLLSPQSSPLAARGGTPRCTESGEAPA